MAILAFFVGLIFIFISIQDCDWNPDTNVFDWRWTKPEPIHLLIALSLFGFGLYKLGIF